MSMAVDFSTPMTDEEYAYLQQRSQTARIEQLHAMHGTTDADYAHVDLGAGAQAGPRPQAMLQGEARAARREQLLEELAALSGDEDDEESESESENLRPYAEWSGVELDAELGVRELPKTGTKADKVKRLEEDDAAE